MNRQEWLHERQKGIGGSDVGAIIGVDRYRNIVDVWLDKTNQALPTADNYAMARGRALEQTVRQQFCTETGLSVELHEGRLDEHPIYPFLRASYDGLTSDGGVLEVKTMNAFVKKMPESYHWQLQHYLYVSRRTHGYFAIDAGGMFTYHRVEVDPDYETKVLPQLIAFWTDNVLARAMPSLPPSARPEPVTDDMAEADEAQADLISQYRQLHAQITDLTEQKDSLKDQIIAAMSGCSGLHHRGQVLATYKAISTNRFDQKRFAKDHPDLAKQYTKQANHTRLTVK